MGTTDEAKKPMFTDFCRYDSDCQTGYVCDVNRCELPQYLNELPQQSEIGADKFIVDSELGEPYALLEESLAKPRWIEEDVTEVTYITDECGNIFDQQNQLIWGNGDCNVDDAVVGSQSSVISATNTKKPSWQANGKDSQRIIVHTDSLIEPQLNSAVRFGLCGLTIVQLVVGLILLLRYFRYVR